MLKKYSAVTKNTFAAFAVPLLGIISEIVSRNHNFFAILCYELFSSLDLIWFSRRASYYFNFNFNSFNLYFYLLLLLGAILYVRSKQKETRLIRFVFSLIFLSKVLQTTAVIIRMIVLRRTDISEFKGLILEIAFFVSQIFWIYLSYKIITYFKQIKSLEKTDYQYGEITTTYFTPASTWQRVFHLVTDGIITVLVFSVLIDLLIRIETTRFLLLKMQMAIGERISLLVVIVFFRSLYYFFNERVFGATPAKFLTETRVVDDNGYQPSSKIILVRTFSRFVPFELLSFLGNSGWHDKWSRTDVVKEIRIGVKGNLYFLIFPGFIFIMIIVICFSMYK